ncbi:MAG: PspC domain-containing protein [Treponema sp.]|nr:PspC domain-containing protein [Treponema sp.]MBQ6566749.1 PspC domain-containing protein [Treponema sp.]
MAKRIYKSSQKTLCGVCGGIAEYFNLDPTIVRLLWVVLTLAGGSGIIAYIVCALVIPDRPSSQADWGNSVPKTEGESEADKEFNSHF